MLLQLATWTMMVTTILSQCVSRLRSDGVGFIVGHRLFSNGSLGVVDDQARFMIYNSAGVLFYKENLNLPNDPQRSSKYRLVYALIGNGNNTLYLQTTYYKHFTYFAGAITQTYSLSYVYELMYWGPHFNFPNFGVGMVAWGARLFMVQSGKLVAKASLDTGGPNSQGLFNISYISRTSVNPLLNEFYFAMYSNRTFIGRVDQTAMNFVPNASTAASSIVTEPSFYVITSSIGSNSQYIAFAGYYPVLASNKYNHYLRVKQRSPIASVSLQITDYHIWSVALDNTTATKMYFLTHDGSLYSTTFTTSSISTPTLLVQDVFIRYANLEILSPTTLLLRTIESMAIFDIATSTIQIEVNIKLTLGRPFGSKMFVLTYNYNASLYDLGGSMPVRDASFSYTGKVKQLIVNSPSNNFYVLTSSALYTYSLSTYLKTATLTIAQAKTMVNATSIISLNDIASLVLQPNKIMLLIYGIFSSNQDSVMLVLNGADLTLLKYFWTGMLDNLLSLTIGGGVVGKEYISLFRPNFMSVFYYSTSDVFTNPNIEFSVQYVPVTSRPETANLKNVITVSLPSGDKMMPRTDLQSGKVHQAQVNSHDIFMASRANLVHNWVGFLLYTLKPNTMVHKLNGYLNSTMVASGPMKIEILSPDFDASKVHDLTTDDFLGGVGYQRDDDSLVFFNGEYEIIKINPVACYADPTKEFAEFLYPCSVANCKYCSAFNAAQCSVCTSPYVLKEDYSACLSTCNPGYLLNGMCYNNCPIEYYKYNAAINTCETASGCGVTKLKLILGDMCNSVASCPAGSTANASKYCTFGTTSAANPTSTAIVASPCTGGKLYWPHFSMCVNPGNSSYANYTVSGGIMYCNGGTHYYDVASKRCLKTCGLYSGVHPEMGLICVTAANCNTAGMFTDDITGGIKLCTSVCNATLWTNLVAKSCVATCPYPGTYVQISNRTCLSSCGALIYTLETNKSCLTSAECLSATLLKTSSTMTCASSCTSTLYLNAPTSECLTGSQCIALGRLLSTADMKCVATCSASQYLLVGTSQCLTASQCKSVSSSSGGGFLSEEDKKCVSTCNSTQYLLISSSQCLSEMLCKSTSSGSGGGLLSEGNKRCVAACNSTQFLLSITSQCLTEAACIAASGYGKLSMSDRKCVAACSTVPQQYLATLTSKCWLSTECVDPGQGNGVTDNALFTCDSSCSTGLYRLTITSECLTASACKSKNVAQGGSLLSEENMLCVSSCTPSQYYLAATSQCLSSALCQAAFGNTGYLDEVGKNCVASCSSSTYQLTSSRQCLSDSQCLAAYSLAGLLSEFDHHCVSSCSVTQYLLEITNQCLSVSMCIASNGDTGLLSTLDRKCVTSCSASQYLLPASSSCLSDIECRSQYSGTGLTNTRDKTCVSSCPADLYIMASTQQCLTASDCHAYSNNTGLISKSDMKCLTSCQSNQYLLSSAKECLLANECRAFNANSGLLSESDKICVASCQPAQYLLESTHQCLTESECLNSDPVGGYVSNSDMKCLDQCGSTQFLLEASSRCANEAECWTLNFFVAPTSKLCQPKCLTNEYQDDFNHYCYTKAECLGLAMLTKSSSLSNLCVSACDSSDYLDSAQQACMTRSECTNDNGHFVVEHNKTCMTSCPSDLHLSLDQECMSSCPTSYYIEEGLSKCVQQCPNTVSIINATRCLSYLNFKIIAAEQTDHDSVVVILEVYFESNSTSTVTSFSVELATLFKQVGIVTDTSNNTSAISTQKQTIKMNNERIEIEFTPAFELKQSYRVVVTPDSSVEFVSNSFRVAFREQSQQALIALLPFQSSQDYLVKDSLSVWSKMGKWISRTVTATKLMTPLVMTMTMTFMDVRGGSFLCLVVQTYTKLMMLTHMNFKLEYNEYSVMYYDVFREFLDAFNEKMMDSIVGENIVEKNKQYVCEKGFEKLCFLTVEDNFFMAHMLALFIIAGQTFLVYVLAKVCHVLKYTVTGDLLISKLKNIMFYAFMLENGIEFWFTLLLNALIFVYRIAILAVMKVGGYVCLIFMLAILIKLLYYNSTGLDRADFLELGVRKHVSKIEAASEEIFRRMRAILKDLTKDEAASWFLKSYLLHDFVFAAVLTVGRYLGSYQMAVWLIAELFLLIMMAKYRPFSKKAHNIRQIVIEFLFLVLLVIMTIVPFYNSSNKKLSVFILIVSMLILVIDLVFVLAEFVKLAIALVKQLITPKKNIIRSGYSRPNMISHRADSISSSIDIAKLGEKKQQQFRSYNEILKINKSLGNLTSSKMLSELASRNKNMPTNRIVPSMFDFKNKSTSSRQVPNPKAGKFMRVGSSSTLESQPKPSRLRSSLKMTNSDSMNLSESSNRTSSVRSILTTASKLHKLPQATQGRSTDRTILVYR